MEDYDTLRPLSYRDTVRTLLFSAELIIVSGCVPRLFLSHGPRQSEECGVQVDPRSDPSLSWCSYYARRNEGWPERGPCRAWTFKREGTDSCEREIGNLLSTIYIISSLVFLFQVENLIKEQRSKGVKVLTYIECSALEKKNLNNVFEEAVKLGIAKDETPNPQKTCTII